MTEYKGHPATPKRLEKARREGKVLKSPLITQLLSMVSIAVVCASAARLTWVKNRMLLEYCWSRGLLDPTACAVGLGRLLLETVAPGLIFGSLVSIIVESLQVGVRFNFALAAPRTSCLDVGSGLKKIAGNVKGAWQIALRLALFSLVLFWFSPDMIRLGVSLWSIEHEWRLSYGFQRLAGMFALAFGVASASAAIDYLSRRREFHRQLSMSTYDLRHEHREDEGDPYIRAQRQALFRSMTYAEMAQRTRQSMVIVVERTD